MDFYQALGVVKEAMRRGVSVAVYASDDAVGGFTVGLARAPEGMELDAFVAALDQLDAKAVTP